MGKLRGITASSIQDFIRVSNAPSGTATRNLRGLAPRLGESVEAELAEGLTALAGAALDRAVQGVVLAAVRLAASLALDVGCVPANRFSRSLQTARSYIARATTRVMRMT